MLIKVELHPHFADRQLPAAASFRADGGARDRRAHGHDALPPEQLTHSRSDLSAFTAPPAPIVASTTSAAAGIALLLPLGWLLYGMRAAAFPWWLLLVWLANGAARRRVRARQTLNPWEPLPRRVPQIVCRRLGVRQARPPSLGGASLAVAAASVASDCERLSTRRPPRTCSR